MTTELQFKRSLELIDWLVDGYGRHGIPFSLWRTLTPETIEDNYNVEFSKSKPQ